MRLQLLVPATVFAIGSTRALLHPVTRAPRFLSSATAQERRSAASASRYSNAEITTRPSWTPPSCPASSTLATTIYKGMGLQLMKHRSRLARFASHTTGDEHNGGAATIDEDDEAGSSLVDRFVTPPLRVYIEDTDAYGVMYNGNYLRAYDRALHTLFVPTTTSAASLPLASKSWSVGRDDNWSIVSVEEIKFKSPPPLGGTYCIEGARRQREISARGVSLLSSDSLEGTVEVHSHDDEPEADEIWDMIMRSSDGSTVYNMATGVKLAQHDASVASPAADDWLPCPPPLSPPDGSSTTAVASSSIDTFRTYRDEFEPHLGTHVPLRIALNYMERSRTNAIGGPDRLHELQTQHNVLYVVTAVRDCSLVAYGGTHSDQGDRPAHLRPGMLVDVETTFRVRKRGAVIDCYHTLLWEPPRTTTTAVERHRVAQGVVTIMALDAATRRPTSKLPAWLLSRFNGSSISC